MERLQGMAVSPGVAIGKALVMDNEGFRIPRRFLPHDAVEDELERLDQSIEVGHGRDRGGIAIASPKSSATQYGGDLLRPRPDAQRSFDSATKLEEMIRQRHYSPEYSVSRVLRHYAKVFQSLEGAEMPERANDIFDIEKRAAAAPVRPAARRARTHPVSEVLVLAHNLTPSETANLNPQVCPRLRHRSRRTRQPHRNRGRRAWHPGRRRHRALPHRSLRRRDGDHRRRPGSRDPASG